MKNKMIFIGMIMLVSIALLSACGVTVNNNGEGIPDEDESGLMLEGQNWVLDTFGTEGNLQPPFEDSRITIQFDLAEGLIGGSAGCNTYFGGFVLSGDSLEIDEAIGMTMMACFPQEIMDQETLFGQILGQVYGYRVQDGQLFLLASDQQVLVFSPLNE